MTEVGNGRPMEVRMALIEERMLHMEKQQEELRETLLQVNAKMTGVLAAVAASAVMLAIILIVNGWHP